MFHLNHLPNAVPDEKVVYCLRRHPFTLIGLILGMILLFFLPFGAYAYLNSMFPDLLTRSLGGPLFVLICSLLFLFFWLFLFQNFLDYYLDIWIVTTKRILNIEQTGLFKRRVSELRLYRIQDVTATVNGLIPSLLDFGAVEIQTAGEKDHFEFEDIPHPNLIAKTILDLSEKDRREHLDEAVEEFAIADREQDAEEK